MEYVKTNKNQRSDVKEMCYLQRFWKKKIWNRFCIFDDKFFHLILNRTFDGD